MKKTLVLHPFDNSTSFLNLIYENKEYDVINDFNTLTKEELKEKIKDYDKIIILGHGTPNGLINIQACGYGGYIIDDSFADILRKKETVTIWCNSDMFAIRNRLSGFHTGMIISEVSEASWVLKEKPLNTKETLDNMTLFSKVIGECIEETPEKMKRYILSHYKGKDSVTQFNRSRIMTFKF